MGSDGVRDPHGRIQKMVSEHRVLSPKQKGKESGVVDSEVKKEKNGKKEIRKVVKEKNDRHSVSEMEASVPMRRPKIRIEKVSGGAV